MSATTQSHTALTEYLPPNELHQLTGYARSGQQTEWLAKQGIPHRNVDCRIIVSRYHINLAEIKRKQLAALKKSITPYILRPDAEVYPCGTYPPIGEFTGIYMLFSEDGRVNYVGQSVGVGYRNVQHFWAMRRGKRLPFVEYAAIEVPDLLRNHMEVAHIHALQPPENCIPRGALWERHDEAVKLIREAWGEKREFTDA